MNVYKLYAIALLMFCTSSCAFKSKSVEFSISEFWTEFQARVSNRDTLGVSELMSFPLLNGQILLGRYENEGLTRDEFFRVYEIMFSDELVKEIVHMPFSELKLDTLNRQIHNEAYMVQIEAGESEEEKFYTVFFIGKVSESYKVVHVDFAG